MRVCNQCKEEKILTQFYRDSTKTGGRGYVCKLCASNGRKNQRAGKYVRIQEKFGKLIEGSRGKVTVTHKCCSKCNKWKPHKCFKINKSQLLNLSSKCVDCYRDHYLRSNYGISLDEYTMMLRRQDSKCCICGVAENQIDGREVLYVDHCHATGAVRGLLCSHCNSMLGYARDSIEILKAGIRYLS